VSKSAALPKLVAGGSVQWLEVWKRRRYASRRSTGGRTVQVMQHEDAQAHPVSEVPVDTVEAAAAAAAAVRAADAAAAAAAEKAVGGEVGE